MNLFTLKKYLDNTIYSTFNSISMVSFYIHKKKINKIIAKNKLLENKHKGERCFILGNGPSLKDMNLIDLVNETTFCVNFFSKSSIYQKIKPTYYVMIDNDFFTKHIQYTSEIIKELPGTIFLLNYKAFKLIDKLGINTKNIHFMYNRLVQYDSFLRLDCTSNMTVNYNVVNACIQMAIYMGFKEIYLLGCDLDSFATLNPKHCYEEDNKINKRSISIGFELECYYRVFYQHYAFNEFATKNNISIYNLTPGGLLDAYPRKIYQEII